MPHARQPLQPLTNRMTPIETDDFLRAFALGWSNRDAAAIADLFAEDADFLTLTGLWAEGRVDIEAALAAEFSGACARARLVTGRVKVRGLAVGVTLVLQRFVLSGIRHANGRDAGRIGAVLAATLVAGPQLNRRGWYVASAQFAPEG